MLGPSVQAILILRRLCAKQRTLVEAEASFDAAQGRVSRTGIPCQTLLRVGMGRYYSLPVPKPISAASMQTPKVCAAWCTAGHGLGFPRNPRLPGYMTWLRGPTVGKGGYSRHRPGPFRHCTLSRISCCP
jgi:hypothetical protein